MSTFEGGGPPESKKEPLTARLEKWVSYAEKLIDLYDAGKISFGDAPEEQSSEEDDLYDALTGPELVDELRRFVASGREVQEKLATDLSVRELLEVDGEGEVIEEELPLLIQTIEARRAGSTEKH